MKGIGANVNMAHKEIEGFEHEKYFLGDFNLAHIRFELKWFSW